MTQIELMRENADLRLIGEQDRNLTRMLNTKLGELAEEKDGLRLALQAIVRIVGIGGDYPWDEIRSIARAALTAKS